MLNYCATAELDELTGDDLVIDFAYLAEEDFLLIVLLTAKGDVQVLYEIGQDKPRRRVVSVPSLWGRSVEPTAVCIGPEASFLAFALLDGDVLVIPSRLLLDVTWGACGFFSESSPFLVPVSSSVDPCLRVPTCIVSFTSKNSPQPVLLCSNKGGQVLIVDLFTRKLAIEVQAPESVHRIEIFDGRKGIDLLVTGFTGIQWILPLESGERGLRETLEVLIPSDLKTLDPPTASLMRCSDGVLRLDSEKKEALLAPSLSYFTSSSHPPPFTSHSSSLNLLEFTVPSYSSWCISTSTKVIFALSGQSTLTYKLRFGISSKEGGMNCEGDWLGVVNDSSREWRCIGMIPRREKASLMPHCFVVNERGLLRLLPDANGNAESWLLESFLFSDFPSVSQLKEAAECIVPGGSKQVVQRLMHSILERFSKGNNTVSTTILTKIVTVAKNQEMNFEELVTMMEKFRLDHLLLPQMLLRIEANPREPWRKKIVFLFVRSVQAGLRSCSDADCALSCFLCRHSDLRDGLSQCLSVSLWRSASLLLPRDPNHSAIVLSFLLQKGSSIWDSSDVTTRSLLLCLVWPLQWDKLGVEEVSSFLSILSNWQPSLISDLSALRKCARVASVNLDRCGSSARLLLVVSSLFASSCASQTTISASPSLITAGLNCSLAFCVDRRLYLSGELSSVQPKTIESEVLSSDGSTPKPSPVHKTKTPIQPPSLVSLDGVEVHTVVAGTEHIVLLSSDGRLFSWGRNRYGQCGVGHSLPVVSPTLVEGEIDWCQCRSLSAGQFHSACLMDDGISLYTWGWAFYGQLGHSRRKDASAIIERPEKVEGIPECMISVSCGRVHTVLLSQSGSIWVVGGGAYGQLGTLNDTMKEFQWTKIDLGSCSPVKILQTKFYHTIAVTEDNRVFEWGRNPQELKMKMFVMRRLKNAQKEGKETDKTKPPLPVTIPKDFLGITEIVHCIGEEISCVSTGLSHTAILTKKGNLFTWGKSLDFQLGHGNKSEKGEPWRVSEPEGIVWSTVHAGGNHTIGVSCDGRVWSWGRNDQGQCAIPPVKGVSSPRKYFFQAKEGSRRCVQLADDSVYVSSPTLVPTLSVQQPQESVEMDRNELVSCVMSLDLQSASIASRLLSSLSSPSTALVHLLAGNMKEAIRSMQHNNTKEQPPTALVSLMWDIVANHEDCQTRSLVSSAFSSLPRTSSTMANRQLRSLWPGVWGEEGTQKGLSVQDRLTMMSSWNPPPSQPSHIVMPSSSLEGTNGRSRVFPSCLHVIDASIQSDSCTICLEKWKCLVKESFDSIDSLPPSSSS